jgi:hypothetical protein
MGTASSVPNASETMGTASSVPNASETMGTACRHSKCVRYSIDDVQACQILLICWDSAHMFQTCRLMYSKAQNLEYNVLTSKLPLELLLSFSYNILYSSQHSLHVLIGASELSHSCRGCVVSGDSTGIVM